MTRLFLSLLATVAVCGPLALLGALLGASPLLTDNPVRTGWRYALRSKT